ncbi:conserved hypothetical protein [Hyphomicrobiales bacterium]|nr:conserved hypothetical protein [Hyphomicrobiales bacterium]CAH1669180.1 conserved hypothetical protein [Hyphomicrobiales bacterium]
MLREVIFRDDQKITTPDLNNLGAFSRQTFDALVANAVSSLRYYTGFTVTKTGQTEITVASGHYWGGGPVFVRSEPTVFNVLTGGTYMPNVTKRIVAIVAYGEAIETDVQERSFEIDDQGNTEPQSVAMERLRYARIALVPGAESPSPVRPTLDVGLIPVAWVTLSTSGVDAVEMDESYRLPSVESLKQLIDAINVWRAQIGQILDTIQSELVRIQAAIPPDYGDLLLRLLARLEALENLAKQPASAVKTFIDKFSNLSDSDTAYAGYAALVDDGLRFPQGTPSYTAVALANPLDAKVKITNGIMTPAQDDTAVRLAISNPDGALSISQYPVQTTERDQKMMTRTVTKYGDWFNLCRGGPKTSVGDLLRYLGDDMTLAEAKVVYETLFNTLKAGNIELDDKHQFEFRGNDGETYTFEIKSYKAGRGAYNIRLVSLETHEEPYWDTVTKTVAVTASQITQTFLNATNGWLTEVGIQFDQVGTTSDVQVYVIEVDSDKPLKNSIISRGAIPVANLVGNALNKCQIEPVYLKGGRAYAIGIASTGNHFVKVRTGNKYLSGSAFYLSDLGEWEPVQNSGDICISLFFGAFKQSRIEVQMQPLTRVDGIAGIRLNAAQYVPEGTQLLWEVQRAGKWYQISEGEYGALDGNPTLVNLRAVFVGTRDLMPAIDMTQTEIELLGPVGNLTHFSKERTLASSTTSIQVHYDIAGYDASKHTFGCSLILDGGATETADSVTVTPDPLDATTARAVAVFTPATLTKYRVKTTGSRGSAAAGFVATERRDFVF